MIVQGVSALPFDESASFSAPAAFGAYRVLHQIGSGVLGPVFRTYEPQRDRLVAVKAFRLDIVPEDTARLADALRKLVAAHLTHPHIVPAIDAGLEGTTAFLAMDYVSGETLDVALRHLAPSTLDRAAPVLSSIASAIDAAWTAGFGHGALHPRDVFLVAGTDDVMVTGFGVLPALESIGVKAPARRPYSAPERAAGEPWDIRADVYSLGAIAHELLTRRRPAGSGEQDGSFATGMTPEQRVWIRKILAAALNERPANRFATPTALADAIAAVARGEAPPALPEVVETAPAADTAAREGELDSKERSRKKTGPVAPLFDAIEPMVAASAASVIAETSGVPDTDGASSVEAAELKAPAPAGGVASIAEPEGAEPIVAPARTLAPPPPPKPAPALDAPSVSVTPTAPITASVAAAATSSTSRPPTSPIKRPAMIAEPDAFRTRLPAAPVLPPAPEAAPFPWLAVAAGVVAGIAIGLVGGYQLGVSRAPQAPATAATAAVPPAVGPGTPTDTDVKVAPDKSAAEAAKTAAPQTPPTQAPAAREAAPPASPVVTTGRVTIRSTPSGATVTIDGKSHVTSPASIRDLPLGAHTAVIARSGFVTRTEKFTLTVAAPTKELSVTLEAVAAPKSAARPAAPRPAPAAGTATTGTLTVDSRPRGATVIVDGKTIGATPTQVAKIAPGSHTLRIELSGYKTLATTVVVKAGETTPIAVSLELGRGGGPHKEHR